MNIHEIPLGQWLPSQPSYKNPGCEVAKNCIPTSGGSYGPLRGISVTDESILGRVQGAKQLYDNSGNSIIVGGTAESLFTRRSGFTETTGLTNIGTTEAWDFAQFNDFVIATGSGNSPQYLDDIDSDNTWSALPGSPPNAKYCAKVGEFLMMGNISGAPNRIQWSAYNNPTGSWAADRLTQAGFVDLPTEYGDVQKIVGGRYAVVFQERGIHRLTYVGPPTVWRADDISQGRGCIAPHSVETIGYVSYYLARDGFRVTNGSTSEPIGNKRVNEWMFDTMDQTQLGTVHSAIDWQNECIFWSFASESMGYNDRAIIYSWGEDRWSYADMLVSWLVPTLNDGVDLEGLDAIYGNLDAIPMSLDSVLFQSRGDVMGCFSIPEEGYLVDIDGTPVLDGDGSLIETADTAVRYCTLGGAPIEATWETGQAQVKPGRRTFVSGAYPLMVSDTRDERFTLLLEDNLGARTTSAEKAVGFGGFAPVRGEGHKVAMRMVKPSGSEWSEALAVQVMYGGAGMR